MKLGFSFRVLATDALFAVGTLSVLGLLVGAVQFGRTHPTAFISGAGDDHALAVATTTPEKGAEGTVTSVGEFVPTAMNNDLSLRKRPCLQEPSCQFGQPPLASLQKYM